MHALERHREFSSATWKRLTYGLPLGAFYVALTSIPYRESWKYGERAYRYCQHDAGHVLAALRLAVAMLGWFAQLLPAVGDDQISRLLGLDRDDAFDRGEPEVPELLLLVDSAAMGCCLSQARLSDRALNDIAEADGTGESIGSVASFTYGLRSIV